MDWYKYLSLNNELAKFVALSHIVLFRIEGKPITLHDNGTIIVMSIQTA